jgi:hypothetical protein
MELLLVNGIRLFLLNLCGKNLIRIIKDNSAIALFGSEPFSSALRMSNIKNFTSMIGFGKNQRQVVFKTQKNNQ